MTESDEGPLNQSAVHEDAASVLMEIARDEDIRKEHSLIVDYFDDDDLRSILDLAWRYQFVDDRHAFKKGIRDLQQHVANKARTAIEADE